MMWGYEPGTVLPDKWHTLFPIANGSRQSPINLDEKLFKRRQEVKALELNYKAEDITIVENNGKTVTFHAEGKNSQLSGGFLTKPHQLAQFHFHWGSNDHKGSEHTFNGIHSAAELHLVHLNTKYSSFEEALKHGDGLCVIGVFLTVVDDPSAGAEGFNRIAELIQNVKYKNQKHNFVGGFDVKSILPKDLSRYASYEGSLTTPPLSECVQWINILETVKISKQNMAAFRSMFSTEQQEGSESVTLCDNYRLPEPLHDRPIHIS